MTDEIKRGPLAVPTLAMLRKMFWHDPEISQWHTPLPNHWEPPIMLSDGSLVDRHHSDRR
jgi:hypothetical protein